MNCERRTFHAVLIFAHFAHGQIIDTSENMNHNMTNINKWYVRGENMRKCAMCGNLAVRKYLPLRYDFIELYISV